MSAQRYDVVVVGAGTAGAGVAEQLARRGLIVALLDQRSPEVAGARWVNGVPAWMFAEAGIDGPQPPELRPNDGAFLIHGVSGARRVTLDPSPVVPVDMRLLVARLQAAAVARGVDLVAPARAVRFEFDARGRPVALVTKVGDAQQVFRADLFIDASGLNGALRQRVPQLAATCPAVPRVHLCSAAQAVHTVRDLDAAHAALDRLGARVGDVVCTIGLDGGFSTANFSLDAHGEVDLLSGAIAEPGRRSGPAILAGLREAHPWIGPELFGGAGAIPLRRPYDRLGVPGLALIGNAACQVFSAHGSGIGIGLIAGRVLAEAVAQHADPGSEEAVWAYQARFQREWGGLLAAYDAFRRASQALSGAETDALMGAGLMVPQLSRAALAQRLAVPNPLALARLSVGAVRAPRLAARFGGSLARIPKLLALYRRHPKAADAAALRRWSHAVARAFAEAPDVA